MIHIHTFASDLELHRNFLKHFQEFKVIKQNVFYMDDGALNYYKLEDGVHEYLTTENYYKLILEASTRKKKMALISLGCGNSQREAPLLEILHKDKRKFSYFGIDSSTSMIELSYRKLQGTSYDSHLICADFASENFRSEFGYLVKEYPERIYAFLGGTLGNVEQDYMADILEDLLDKGDKLILEVFLRKGNSEKHDRLLFEENKRFLQEQQHYTFQFFPLKRLGIKPENGEWYLEMVREETLDLLRFKFMFLFTKKTVVNYKGKTITFLPGNTAELINRRFYDTEKLINFFEQRNCKFLQKTEDKEFGQFLFEKK